MSKKIYKKAEYIFKTTEREELKRRQEYVDYIRKDAKIHFSKDGKN
jgi:hypothetical protein